MTRTQDALLGYDFFVSYAWSDGHEIAQGLYEALAKKGLRCFVDRRSLRASDSIQGAIATGLRRSHTLLLIATDGARSNDWVRTELGRHVAGRARPVMTLRGDRPLLDKELETWSFDPAVKLHVAGSLQLIFRTSDSLAQRIEECVPQIIASYRGVRREALAKRWLAFLLATFVVLAALSSILGLLAEHQRRRTVRERDSSLALLLTERSSHGSDSSLPLRTMLAAEAVRTTLEPHGFVTPEVENHLRDVLSRDGGRPLRSFRSPLTGAAFGKGGSRVLGVSGGPPEILTADGVAIATSLPAVDPNDHLVALENGDFLLAKTSGSLFRLAIGGTTPTSSVVVAHSHLPSEGVIRLGGLSAVAVGENGKWIATGAVDGTVRVFSAPQNGETSTAPLREKKVHGSMVSAIALSADGRRVYSAGLDDRICAWDWDSERNPIEVAASRNGIMDVLAIDHEQQRLATGTQRGVVQVFNLSNSAWTIVGSHSAAVTVLRFGEQGAPGRESWIYSGAADGTLGAWKLGDSMMGSGRRCIAAHEGAVLALERIDGTLHSIDARGTERVWDCHAQIDATTPWRIQTELKTDALLNSLQPIAEVGWSAVDESLWFVGAEGRLTSWNPDRGSRTLTTRAEPVEFRVAARGSRIVWIDREGSLFTAEYSAEQGLVNERPLNDKAFQTEFGVGAFELCSDGAWCVHSVSEKHLRLVSPASESASFEVELGTDPFSQAIFSPGSHILAVRDGAGCVRVWNPDRQDPARPIATIALDESPSRSVAVTASGRFLVCGCDDGRIVALDLAQPASPRIVVLMPDADDPVHNLAAHPTQDRVASIGSKGILRVFDVCACRSPTQTFEGRIADGGLSLAWSPDGASIAVGGVSESNCAWIFDSTRPGSAPLRFPGSESSVFTLVWSPSGRYLAALDGSGEIRVHPKDPRRLLDAASQWIGRDLTEAERERYVEIPNR